jgi:hypothetical protein
MADVYAPVQTPIGRLFVAIHDDMVTAVGRTAAGVEASVWTRFGRHAQRVSALPMPLA